MSSREDKVWIAILSAVSGVLVVVTACLWIALAARMSNADVRYAFDIVESFGDKAAAASKLNTLEACEILWQLHYPSFDWPGAPHPFHGRLAYFVESQRTRAIREVIRYLQSKTGDDLGTDPEKWLMKYGSESVRDDLKTMKGSTTTASKPAVQRPETSRSAQEISPTAVHNSYVGASLEQVVAANDAKNPILTDEDLIATFQNHRTTFDQLLQMVTADSKLHRVDCDWTDPQDPKEAVVSSERIAQYRRLLEQIGCHRGFAAFPARPGIYFISAARGLAVGGSAKGFYYFEGTPPSVVTNTAVYSPKHPKDSYEVFRHIEGHWYVYLERD